MNTNTTNVFVGRGKAKAKRTARILLNVLLVAALTLQIFAVSVLPAFAGHVCPICDEWINGDPYCPLCYCCESCTDYLCDDCGLCVQCAYENDAHCTECGETCLLFAPESDYCNVCGRCENCAEILGSGGVCRECFEEYADTDNLCPNCEDVVIFGPDGEEFETLGECGGHCESCFEELVCPECGECSACNDTELCDYCGICLNCVFEYEYHCPECGECYEDVGRCYEGGDHCADCCYANDYLCESCGICCEAEGLERCEICGLCENCMENEHCPECGECYEEFGQCDYGGDHCYDCCVICDNCGECVIANEVELCDYCGYCTICCREFAESYGPKDICALDPKRAEKIKETHDASSTHFYTYIPTANGHVWGCCVEGCDVRGNETTHRPGDWQIVTKPLTNREGVRARFCLDCKKELEKESMPRITFHFTKQPSGGFAKNGNDFLLNYTIVSNYGDPCYLYKALFYRVNGGEWKTDLKEAYQTFVSDRISFSPKLENTTFEWRLYIYDGLGYSFVSEPFTVTWGENHIHSYEIVGGLKSDTFGKTDGSGTCHRYVCSCGEAMEELAHAPVVLTSTQTCKNKGYTKYLCTICGEVWTVANEKAGKHQSNGIYSSVGGKHFTECVFCHARMDDEEHVWQTLKSTTVCTKETREEKCSLCGETRTIVVEAAVPNHDININWIHGNDESYHWYYCLACGLKITEKHSFISYGNGSKQCSECFYIPKTDGKLEVFMSEKHSCSHIGTVTPKFVSTDSALIDRLNKGTGVTYLWYYYDNGTKVTVSTDKVLTITPQFEETIGCGDSFSFDFEVFIDGTSVGRAYTTIEPLGSVKGTAPTCNAPGTKDHYICTCGATVDSHRRVIDITVPATGKHVYSDDCDQTCNFCGSERIVSHKFVEKYDDNYHFLECSVCGVVRDHTEHTLSTRIIKEASCYEKGSYELGCSCGFLKEFESEMLSHNIQKFEATASTCVKHGYSEHYKCVYCGKVFKDAAGNEPAGKDTFKLPLDPENHEGGKFHCDEEKHWVICKCGVKYGEEAHTLNEKGVCTVCKYSEKTLIKPSKLSAEKKENHDDQSEVSEGKNENKEDDKTGIPLWAIILIILAAILLLALIILILILLKKKKKPEADQE